MKNIPANFSRPGFGPRPTTAVRDGRPLSASRAGVLDTLRETSEPSTLADLTELTGLHANTLREHLDALVARGLVHRFRGEPSGRGRPAWRYKATEPDVDAAGSEYAGLAATLAAHISRTSQDPRADAVAAGHAWGHELARKAGTPEGSGAVAARRQVVKLLDEIGFSPEADDRATTARLTRCPLLETAREFPDVVCGVHLGIVRGALDEYGVDSTRTDLEPFAEPGACRLALLTRTPRP
ncbi:MAG TPA: helix-turn-helix domain-containing protein [Nocardioidaceae bacterium]|nr:helix-turn-helix domain-containing protein [Nocardioidaceae bacterium]